MTQPVAATTDTERTSYGAVFTKRWMVDLILDHCGYTSDENLASRVAVEPACGDGAFLVPMVMRLSDSLRRRGRRLSEAVDALRAYDLQQQHVERCRRLVCEALVSDGWSQSDAAASSEVWIRQGDYLLTWHEPDADFVIGNPPYIRSDDLGPQLRDAYLSVCKTMTRGSDVFVGFIERGLMSLRKGGVLAYIVADRWMHNNYGRRLRGLVADCFCVEAVFEMHGVDAFAQEVSAYPAVTQIRRTGQGEVLYAKATERFDADAATRLLSWARGTDAQERDRDYVAARLPGWFATDSMWPSASPARLALLESLNERCGPLEDPATGTKVGIGIATGADAVFVTSDSSVAEPERLVPLVKTKHIQSGVVEWGDTWLVNPWESDGRLVELAHYPKLAGYLDEHAGALKARHIASRAPEAWYRTIDKIQPGLADSPKLLLADMKATIQPVLEPGRAYPHHNLYWITSTGWDLRVLGGLLLSRVAQMFVEAYGVKMRGGTLRFQAQYLRLVRVPEPATLSAEVEERLADAFERRDAAAATEAALEAYGIEAVPD